MGNGREGGMGYRFGFVGGPDRSTSADGQTGSGDERLGREKIGGMSDILGSTESLDEAGLQDPLSPFFRDALIEHHRSWVDAVDMNVGIAACKLDSHASDERVDGPFADEVGREISIGASDRPVSDENDPSAGGLWNHGQPAAFRDMEGPKGVGFELMPNFNFRSFLERLPFPDRRAMDDGVEPTEGGVDV